jgi:hypothetical protein
MYTTDDPTTTGSVNTPSVLSYSLKVMEESGRSSFMVEAGIPSTAASAAEKKLEDIVKSS